MTRSNRKPRILLYSPIYYPDTGGPAVQAKFLTETLSENGFEVIVIKYNKDKLKNTKEKIISLDWKENPNFIARLYRWFIGPLISIYFIFRFRPHLVIVNSVFWNGLVMGLLCKVLRIPTIIKFAGDFVFENLKSFKDNTVDFKSVYFYNNFSKFLFLIEKFFLGQFKIVWVISEYRKMNVEFLTNKPLIWLQRNFHDFSKIGEIKIGEKRFSSPLVFVTAARLVKHKRIDRLIHTVSKLPYDFHFIIIGEGPEYCNLDKLVTNLNLKHKISFTGKISSGLLFEIFANSSIYLSWSSEEGAPNVFIESLNFGLPIFTANVGGISEMFELNSRAVRLINADDELELFNSLANENLLLNELEFMSNDAFIEGKKFLKSENEKSVIEFINSLIFVN